MQTFFRIVIKCKLAHSFAQWLPEGNKGKSHHLAI